MSELCLITTCMGRLAHLRQSLGAAAAQPGCSCIVVDYSCPENSGDWVAAQYPAVKVVRVPGQTTFSISRARNAGAALADAAWLCFFDADVILGPHFAEQLVPSLQAGKFYIAEPGQTCLLGTMICERNAFLGVGGYDEVYQNWGGEDRDLYDRFCFHGLKQAGYPDHLVNAIHHDDELRVAHFAVTSPRLSQTVNLLYRAAKLDLMRLLARDLTVLERRGLYAEAERLAQLSATGGQAAKWRIPFREARSLLGVEIAATLVYTINPPGQKSP